MSEILFLIEENLEGVYTARAVDVGFSIFTEGESVEELKRNIIEALQCHFDEEHDIPKIIQLHFVKDEVMHYAPGCMVSARSSLRSGTRLLRAATKSRPGPGRKNE